MENGVLYLEAIEGKQDSRGCIECQCLRFDGGEVEEGLTRTALELTLSAIGSRIYDVDFRKKGVGIDYRAVEGGIGCEVGK